MATSVTSALSGRIVGGKVRERVVEVLGEVPARVAQRVRGEVLVVQPLEVRAARVAAGEAHREEGALGAGDRVRRRRRGHRSRLARGRKRGGAVATLEVTYSEGTSSLSAINRTRSSLVAEFAGSAATSGRTCSSAWSRPRGEPRSAWATTRRASKSGTSRAPSIGGRTRRRPRRPRARRGRCPRASRRPAARGRDRAHRERRGASRPGRLGRHRAPGRPSRPCPRAAPAS